MMAHVGERERGAVFRLGRFLRVVGPGTVFVLPLVDRMCVVNLDETLPGWREVSTQELDAMVAFLVLHYPELPTGLHAEQVRAAMRQATARGEKP
jgi:hypothetical protein